MGEAKKKAGEEPREQPEAKAPESPKKKRDILGLFIFLMVAVNLVAVGAMGLFMKSLWGDLQVLRLETQKVAEAAMLVVDEEEEAMALGQELAPKSLGILYPVEAFLVNIASDQGPRFLQTQLEFELKDPTVEDEIARKKPAIRDAIIVLLSSRTYRDLREPTGMKKLRQDLLRTVNNLLSTGKLKDIYFTQFHFN